MSGLGDIAPTAEQIAALGQAVLDSLPEALAAPCTDLVIQVVDFAEKEVLDDFGLEDPFELLGLYQGAALTEKSVLDQPVDQDRIFLYRRPILDYWVESGEALEAIVRHLMIHEIGHHFGFSDEDMDRIEAQA